MRVGIIRCDERAKVCAGYKCFPAIQNRTGKFEGYDTVEIVGFDSCGGCGRGKADKIVARALLLKKAGAEVIHFANCILSSCPFKNMYEKAIEQRVGLPVVRGTHARGAPPFVLDEVTDEQSSVNH